MAKQTIKDIVTQNSDYLKSLKSHRELRDWAIRQGFDNRSAFPKFKLALNEIGIDYDLIKSGISIAEKQELESNIKYSLTLYSDAKASHGRYGITDKNGDVVWHGRFFENDNASEQSSAELEASKKAVWFASKVKEALNEKAISLLLYVDAEWLTYQDHAGQKGYALTQLAKKYNIDLKVKWISGKNNPADKWTVASGFKKWQDNNLTELVDLIEVESDNNSLKGGIGDNETIQSLAEKHNVSVDFIKEQLEKGIKVEMEHTDDPQKAKEISYDHLTESHLYYIELEKMEGKLKENNFDLTKGVTATYDTSKLKEETTDFYINSLNRDFVFHYHKEGAEANAEVSTKEHAETFGIKAEKPLYVSRLFVPECDRNKGKGTEILNLLEDYAKANDCDIIFGYIAQKAGFTADATKDTLYLNNVDCIKMFLGNRGYATNDNTNDFHKVLKQSKDMELSITNPISDEELQEIIKVADIENSIITADIDNNNIEFINKLKEYGFREI